VTKIDVAMDRYQYLIVMGLCLFVTVPLEFALHVRVWRQPGRLARAVVPTAVIFSLWGIGAIDRHHWGFNHQYTIARRLPGRLPIEEVLYFVAIPIFGLLAYEAVRRIGHR
jgi:lycopene cyclase domain-containing protein